MTKQSATLWQLSQTPHAAAILAGSLVWLCGCATSAPSVILRPIHGNDIIAVRAGENLTAPTNRPTYYLISDEYLSDILSTRVEE